MSKNELTMPTTATVERPAGKPWSFADAAEFLGLHVRTLRRAVDAGKLRSLKFGRKTMLADAVVRKLATEGLR